MRVRLAVACVAVAPLLVSATEPVRLKPSTPWVLNYGDEVCRLSRAFGEGETKTILSFESEALDRMDMTAVGKPLRGGGDQVPARFLPVQTEPKEGLRGKDQNGSPALVWSTFALLSPAALAVIKQRQEQEKRHPDLRPPARDVAEAARMRVEQRAFAARAMELEIAAKRNQPVILETGSMGAALGELDHCVRDSMRAWGVDPLVEDKIARPVWAPNPRGWFTSRDYPDASLRKGAQSDVRVRLNIDSAGRPTHCTALTHFEDSRFSQAVCAAFMRRARFQPAELADGTRVPSYFATVVRFRVY
jgi:TonB family protein